MFYKKKKPDVKSLKIKYGLCPLFYFFNSDVAFLGLNVNILGEYSIFMDLYTFLTCLLFLETDINLL